MSTNQVWIIGFRWSLWEMEGNRPSTLYWHKDTMLDVCRMYGKAFIFQHEMTLNDGRENHHFQGYMNLKSKARTGQLAAALNDRCFGIHIQPASDNGKEELKKYCMKDDTRCDGPWADKPIYRGQDLITESMLCPWQIGLLNYCTGPVNNREIIWVCDPEGNSGKSSFCKYMAYHHEACSLTYGAARDLLHTVCDIGAKKIYFFDLTRVKPQMFSSQDLYSAIESIKNGYVLDTKYQGGVMFFEPPHVVCFANVAPEMASLTLDRWNVVGIPPDQRVAARKEQPRFRF